MEHFITKQFMNSLLFLSNLVFCSVLYKISTNLFILVVLNYNKHLFYHCNLNNLFGLVFEFFYCEVTLVTPGFEALNLSIFGSSSIFRWFKLKPPNSISHKVKFAIWDTSLWTLLVKFGHTGLVIVDICHFLTIPGPFWVFSKNGCSQKIKVFSMKEWLFRPFAF